MVPRYFTDASVAVLPEYEGLFAKEALGSPSMGEQHGSTVGLDNAPNDMKVGLDNALNAMTHEVRERQRARNFFLRFKWPVDKEKLVDKLCSLSENILANPKCDFETFSLFRRSNGQKGPSND